MKLSLDPRDHFELQCGKEMILVTTEPYEPYNTYLSYADLKRSLMHHLFVEEKKSQEEIGKMFNTTAKAVSKQLRSVYDCLEKENSRSVYIKNFLFFIVCYPKKDALLRLLHTYSGDRSPDKLLRYEKEAYVVIYKLEEGFVNSKIMELTDCSYAEISHIVRKHYERKSYQEKNKVYFEIFNVVKNNITRQKNAIFRDVSNNDIHAKLLAFAIKVSKKIMDIPVGISYPLSLKVRQQAGEIFHKEFDALEKDLFK